jgi:16S rRNA (guanine966-N2)-methyltransferase
MRVAGGRARGIELRAPSGRRVRPTTSLARQAIFSMLESCGSRCEIEALSRGAAWCDFVDRNHGCCSVIRQNLAMTGFADLAGVYCLAASMATGLLERQYDVIFLDPPYDEPSTDRLLSLLATSRLLAPDALVVVSHGNRHSLSDTHGPLTVWKKRRYGDSHISIYRREEQ